MDIHLMTQKYMFFPSENQPHLKRRKQPISEKNHDFQIPAVKLWECKKPLSLQKRPCDAILSDDTVDGRNPAPLGMYKTMQIMR